MYVHPDVWRRPTSHLSLPLYISRDTEKVPTHVTIHKSRKSQRSISGNIDLPLFGVVDAVHYWWGMNM
jgi:hypothetical protein